MGIPYAEVIGDPISHSLSPAIHGFWIGKLGLRAEYRAERVPLAGLAAHLERRRTDIWWRGCSVTAPLKGAAARLVGDPVGLCGFLGAVNCVTRSPLSCLVASNTDVAGLAEALGKVRLDGAKACLIGAGGAARAALCWLAGRPLSEIHVVARDGERARRAAALLPDRPGRTVRSGGLDTLAAATDGASLIVHATPLGSAGGPAWDEAALRSIRFAPGATAFDMVYAPRETPFLAAARAAGAETVEGLDMLIGQAAPAFALFFGRPAPRAHDAELRDLLVR